MKYTTIIFGLLVHCFVLVGQPLLPLEEAVDFALENNLDLQVERFNQTVSANSVTKANAGLLPTIDLSGNLEYGLAPLTTLEIANLTGGEGTMKQEYDFTNSTTAVLSADVNYTLYDGKRGKYRYKQLQLNQAISETQLDMLAEQVINQTVAAYIAVARQQSLLRINTQSIELSQERLQRLQSQEKYGTANSVQILQAEVDLKSDSASYRTTALNLEQAKNDLNLLLGRAAEVDFTVEENFALTPDLTYANLKADLRNRNSALQLNEQLISQKDLSLSLTQSADKPRIQAYGQAAYLRSTDEANILQRTEAVGINIGVRATYNIFDGGLQDMREQNAVLALEQQRASQAQTELKLEKQLRSAFSQYEDSREQLRIEESNLALFEENYERMQDNFELGQASATDLRTAQLNLDAAKNRITNLKFNTKLAETVLLYLSGRLMN